MTNYIILLPPSEGKCKDGDENKPYRIVENLEKYNYFFSLNNDREYVYDLLREAISESLEKELEKIFDVKGNKLQESVEISLDMLNMATMKAIERYSGVMFNAIDYKSLNEIQKQNFNQSVIFIDGLFGLLKSEDLIPNYKLKINSKLMNVNITKFWNEKLKTYFEDLFKDKLVIDILPEAHRKVIDKNLQKNIITVKFCTFKNNKLVNVGHESKKLKGDIIRYIVSKENTSVDDLKQFEHSQGYIYSEDYSSDNELIYLK